MKEIIFARNSEKFIALLLVMFILLLGIKNAFIQDDAFISFRYAQNFISGHGLTWNIDEPDRVAGYTNFLWTILIAGTMALGVDPVPASIGLGLFFATGTLFFTYHLSRQLFKSRLPALLTLVLLGTNYTFSSYMTGGLETQLQACLFVASTYLAFLIIEQISQPNGYWLVLMSVLFSLAILTRLDSALICTVLYLSIFLSLFRNKIDPPKKRIFLISYLTLPGAIIIGTWFFWEYAYYGDILPNTYYVKATGFSLDILKRGAWYVFSFFKSYFLLPVILLGLIYCKKLISSSNFRIILIMTGLWLLYVVKVGGDFMEFRFLVPITPFIFLLLTNLILQPNHLSIRMALIITIMAGTLYHAITFKTDKGGVESISTLNGHVVNANENWQRVGIVLGELFPKGGVTIATTAAGAIPYYSRLPTIDMLGLNDKWIAKNCALKSSLQAGHTCFAPLEYLIQRNVNILLMHPQVFPVSDTSFGLFKKYDLLPKTTRMIEIPLNEKYKIKVLYINQNDYVDEVIQKFNLESYELFP